MTHILSLLLFSVLCFLDLVSARHSHHQHRYQHRRQDQSLTSSTSAAVATPSAAAALVTDVEQIQDGLSSLPNDFIAFINALESQLKQAKTLIASLLSPSASATATTSLASTTPTTSFTAGSSGLSSPLDVIITRTVYSTGYVYATEGVYSTTAPYANPNATAPYAFGNATAYAASSGSIPLTTGSAAINATTLPLPTASPVFTEPSIPFSVNSTVVVASATTIISFRVSPSPTTKYTFNATANDNVAAYYGQTNGTQPGGLLALCESPDVDIVVLAFVTSFFTPSGMPSASFGPACSGSTPAQQLHAPGLEDCTALAPSIAGCQELGKKVLVSLGGYYANTPIPTAEAATQLASNLWNLFGAGTGLDDALRPFGPNVVVDGFDLDNEGGDPDHYDTLASALRQQFAADPANTYYLSAAPQCPRPDASILLAAMAHADFVWVQFYNNPACDLDSDGFAASFAAWATDLASVSNSTMLYVGTPASAAGGTGYVAGTSLADRIGLASGVEAQNFGGVMLWDGTQAMANVDQDEDDYLSYAKASLS